MIAFYCQAFGSANNRQVENRDKASSVPSAPKKDGFFSSLFKKNKGATNASPAQPMPQTAPQQAQPQPQHVHAQQRAQPTAQNMPPQQQAQQQFPGHQQPAPQQQQQQYPAQLPPATMKDHTATSIEEQMQMNMQIIPVEMLDGSVQQVCR